MIVTIDGPAGAGKSHVARALAKRLDFRYLDTGATYRAVTLAAIQRGVNWDDVPALAEVAGSMTIEFVDDRVLLDGQDVTRQIRSNEVTTKIHHVADQADIRSVLVQLQREIASHANYITEGRDQGTVVFPDAQCKFFLTASPSERARRRVLDLEAQGESTSLPEVLEQQTQRDHRDETRAVGRLQRAADAVEVITDGLSPEQVVDRLEKLVRAKQNTTNSRAK
jgi:cytidylate kinase